jgi:homoaconitase/3-isopropylmalate dehydratase large subunit
MKNCRNGRLNQQRVAQMTEADDKENKQVKIIMYPA